jgi:hypothetical protein
MNNSTCFGQFFCPSSGVFHCTHRNRYTSYRFADSLQAGLGRNSVPSWSCPQAGSKLVWQIPLLCVQWKTPDDGQKNCPKHVEFHSKNKFSEISASIWLYYKKFITMHGHMSVKYVTIYALTTVSRNCINMYRSRPLLEYCNRHSFKFESRCAILTAAAKRIKTVGCDRV